MHLVNNTLTGQGWRYLVEALSSLESFCFSRSLNLYPNFQNVFRDVRDNVSMPESYPSSKRYTPSS